MGQSQAAVDVDVDVDVTCNAGVTCRDLVVASHGNTLPRSYRLVRENMMTKPI